MRYNAGATIPDYNLDPPIRELRCEWCGVLLEDDEIEDYDERICHQCHRMQEGNK